MYLLLKFYGYLEYIRGFVWFYTWHIGFLSLTSIV